MIGGLPVLQNRMGGGSSAIESDICEEWIYGDCLDLSPGEYKLLSKMMQSLTCFGRFQDGVAPTSQLTQTLS